MTNVETAKLVWSNHIPCINPFLKDDGMLEHMDSSKGNVTHRKALDISSREHTHHRKQFLNWLQPY